MALSISAEPVVEPVDEIDPSVNIREIAVAQKPEVRQLEVILDNGAPEALRKGLPDLLKSSRRLFDQGIDLFRCIRHGRVSCDISCCGVHENKIRLKSVQFGIAEDRIFEILVVLGFIELGLDPVVQKEKL